MTTSEKYFIHIPKNGGSSIVDIIRSKKEYHLKGHWPEMINDRINFVKLNICSIPFQQYFTFAVVIHPYQRVVSCYQYLINGGKHTSIDLSYQKILQKYKTFEDFINNLHHLQREIVHLVAQHIFICDLNTDKILVNKVISIENLENELVSIDKCFEKIPKINKSNQLKIHLTNQIKEKIYNIYYKDFKIFGFQK